MTRAARSALVVLVVLALGACGRSAAGSTEDPGSPSPAVTPAIASPLTAGLAPGVVAEVVSSFSLVSDRRVVIGQRVFVVDGPVDRDGTPSFLIQHWGDLEQGLRPDSDFGWLAADEAVSALRPVPLECPLGRQSLRDVAALQIFERPLCFGDADLTFGPVTATDYDVGARTSERWISDDGRPDFFTALPIYFTEPSLEIPDGAWVEVTGHFADPSSAECGSAAEVAWCRQRFVATAVEAVEPPSFVLRGTWRPTAEPPIGGRTGHSVVWTGSELLVWGGIESSRDNSVFDALQPRSGAAYAPATDSWRAIPDAPVEGRYSPIAAWSGRELLVWGGWTGDGSGEPRDLMDGAAYDPVGNRWRKLPPAPLAGGMAVGGWLSDSLVVVTDDGAARYDPSADRWEPLDAAPVRAGWRTARIAGDRFVVIAFGDGATGAPEGATLDPRTATWTTIDVPFGPLDAGVELIGAGDLVVAPRSGQALDPPSGTWRRIAPCEAAYGGTWTGRFIIGYGGAYDVDTETCLDLPPAPWRAAPFDDTNGREFGVGVWTGREYITWSGGTGGHIVWVPNDGAIFRPTDDLDPSG